MRTWVNVALSLLTLAICTYFVWPDAASRAELGKVFGALQFARFAPYLAASFGLMAATHIARTYRWHSLLAPLGVRMRNAELFAISSVGYMAILALPARLGEFVRPALMRQRAHLSGSAALGAVAVERIIDGLGISLIVFAAFFALRGPNEPAWMMSVAYVALTVFSAATIFLFMALRRPQPTVRLWLALSLLPRLAPSFAKRLEMWLLEMIRGFSVVRSGRHMLAFLAWSAIYWTTNALSVWILARGFGLPLSVVGGFAVMGLVAVGITLPNAPGLVGQFQWFTVLGLSLYLGPGVSASGTHLHGQALAFAIVNHLVQVVWYVGMGALAIATPYVAFADLRPRRAADAAV